MQKLIHYLKGVQSEMGKVSWPTKDEITNATTLVVVFSIIFSLIVWVFDLVLSRLLGYLLNI
jgi:preprotein translocase subunit SecE